MLIYEEKKNYNFDMEFITLLTKCNYKKSPYGYYDVQSNYPIPNYTGFVRLFLVFGYNLFFIRSIKY